MVGRFLLTLCYERKNNPFERTNCNSTVAYPEFPTRVPNLIFSPKKAMELRTICGRGRVVSMSHCQVGISRLSPASYLCWNTHVGKVTGCHTGCQEVSRCCTKDESHGMYITHASAKKVNKAAYSGFETQRRCHYKSKTGASVVPKRTRAHKNKNNKQNNYPSEPH